MSTTPDAFVLDHVRTPRGKARKDGALAAHTATDLVVHLLDALRERNDLAPALEAGLVDDVVLGCASQVNEQGANPARVAALLAGWGDAVPGAMLNRFCASGIDAVGQTAARVRGGDLSLAVAGGVESVSRVPMFADAGPLWTDPEVVRATSAAHMGIAGDLNATIEGFGREELDAYAVETHHKAAAAWERGAFARAVVPIGDATVDELVRPGITLEQLAALPPAFAEWGAAGQDAVALARHPEVAAIEHLHTVGTSPAMADGAGLLLLGSREAAERVGVAPRARILAQATTAVDPALMLTAGQSAVEAVLARAGLRPADVAVFEFAEAFAALCLRLRRDLDAGPERLNPHGGTIAMGHAFGATGAILVGSVVDTLVERGERYGVAAVSGAAGLGVAVLVERVGD